MSPPRDPVTGRFIKTSIYAAPVQPVVIPQFAMFWQKRCKELSCQLKRGHRGQHAYKTDFGAHLW